MPSSHKCPGCGRDCFCSFVNPDYEDCQHDCDSDAQWREDEYHEGLIDEETERRIENEKHQGSIVASDLQI
jgi:hypothetical protein